MNICRPTLRAGSALILVIWCLLLLTIAVFGVIELVEVSVEQSANAQTALEARALAASGLALGSEPQLQRDDPVLLQKPAPGRQFQVTLRSEDARLNLNAVLLGNHRPVLVSLFTRWGIDLIDANRAADCLYDWVTPGDLASVNGAKDIDYARAGLAQRPSHQPFKTWREVGEVIGVDALTKAKPDWEESFTLWSEGPLNVNEAPAELLAAVLGIDLPRAQALAEARDGRDGQPGTSDDMPFQGAQALQLALGLSDDQMKDLAGQITFGSSTRRIESQGLAGASRATIAAVLRTDVSPPQYLLWSER